MTDRERKYRQKQLAKQREISYKDVWTDIDKLEYLVNDIQMYSFYWRHGFVSALRHAIKLLKKEEQEKSDYQKVLDSYGIKYRKGSSEEVENSIKNMDMIFESIFGLEQKESK